MTFGDVTDSTTFGGNIAVPLSDNLQVIAEEGSRIANDAARPWRTRSSI